MNALVESWQILKRRWLPAAITLGTVLGAASVYNGLQQSTYEAKGKILAKTPKQAVVLAAPQPGDVKNSLNKWLRSLTVAQKTASSLHLTRTADQVLENITIQKTASSDLFEVGYRDTDPKRAAQVVQKLMEDYLAQDSELQQQEIAKKQAALDKQLGVIGQEVQLAEANLQKFKTEFKVGDLQNEKKALTGAISYLQEELTDANNQFTALEAKSPELYKAFGRDTKTILRAILVSTSPSMQQVLTALQGVEEKIAMEKNRLQKDRQVIEELTNQQGVLWREVQKESQQSLVSNNRFRSQAAQWKRSNIPEDLQFKLVETEAQRDGLDKRISLLNSAIKRGQNQLSTFAPSEEKIRLLEQNIKTSQNKYEKLANQAKLLQASNNQSLALSKIISPATVPTQPISSPTGIHPFWSILTGLSLGTALAMGVDRADKRLKTAAAAQQIIQYPVLGYIPQFPQWNNTKTGNLLTSKNEQPEHVPFRALQSHLKFAEDQGSTQIIVTQIIVVSSAVHQEGKSTVAAQLALASAQAGQRVLLVDADLYHPQQHQFWQVSNSAGLSNVLLNEHQFPESIIEVAENLELLPAGLPYENPSALFSSPLMTELFTQWFSLYDLVVIDATALSQCAEALILSKMADGLLLVVNPQVVAVADLQNAQNVLQQSQQHVMGVVINGVGYHEYQKLSQTSREEPLSTSEPEQKMSLPFVMSEEQVKPID
jgi:polysaccharide biosynthesis transport protein